MSWALVGDVADIVRIETLGSTALVGERSVPSVDTLNPATDRHRKTGHHTREPSRPMEFYCVDSSVRKSVWTLVRQLRGPHFSTCA